MAWIESHQELGRHPKTRRAARLLGVPLVTMVGHLHYLWWWALDFAQDGSLGRYEADEIADAALWEGDPEQFVKVLTGVGFIEESDGCLMLHDWNEYAGKLIERRKSDAERKRLARTSDGHPTDIRRTSDGRRAESVVTVPYRTVPEKDTNVVAPPSDQPTAADAAPAVAGMQISTGSNGLIPFPVTPAVTPRADHGSNDASLNGKGNEHAMADDLALSVDTTGGTSHTRQSPEPSASSPVAAVPARRKGEKELDYWLRIVNAAPNGRQIALLVKLAHDKLDVPDESGGIGYQRLGILARKHGAGLMVRNIFTAAAQHVDGDPLSYLTVVSDKANARRSGQSAAARASPAQSAPYRVAASAMPNPFDVTYD